jgi:acyl transferase domain-containing protein/enoyl-CoA hydratase/carnithine racemase/acyl carrier protein
MTDRTDLYSAGDVTRATLGTVADDLEQEILSIFDREPVERQPKAIVDLHCGDGSRLLHVFQAIRDRSLRGRSLEAMPLRLIGVADNSEALKATARTLHGLSYDTLLMAHDQPEELNQTLRQLGSTLEPCVYLRLFADQWIDVQADEPVNEALSVLARDLPTSYPDRQGGVVDALTVLSRWQRHLRSMAEQAGSSRLLIAQAHSAPSPRQGHDRLAGESPITAEAFITLAASAGLFNDGAVKRHPNTADPCRISFHSLVRRDYVIRHATEGDLERLCELERLCWRHTRSPKKQIQARLRIHPAGQFVIERSGKVLGVIYSQRIASKDALLTRRAGNVHELHQASGPIVQLLAVNIDPGEQNVSYGDQLLELMLQRCGLMTGITEVVGVTLCKSYRPDGGQSFEDYIKRDGGDQDPVLAFHRAHGAAIVKAIPGYRPQDRANLSNGVLVAYDVRTRTRRPRGIKAEGAAAGRTIADPPEAPPLARPTVVTGIEVMIRRLLGSGKADAFARSSPLMEMGLDSADLLSLREAIRVEYQADLETAFFFQYNTAEKIGRYLTEYLSGRDTGDHSTPAGPVAAISPASATTNVRGPASRRPGDVAIVGIGCRLPGGIHGPEQLWDFLMKGQEAITTVPPGRWSWPGEIDPKTRHLGIDRGGFLEDIASFDARFFRITPREAELVDPQQRILLELAWETLEDARCPPSKLAGSDTGVFVGASGSDYHLLLQRHAGSVDAHMGTSTAASVLPNRISYFYDFHGPSLLIDTACSSSLVALHQALRSLRAGECEHALVAGVNVMCNPATTIAYYTAGMLAKDGRCKTFDRAANGYVRSEGALMVLLKPLERAVQHGDRIYAVIKGSAVNHGGQASGLTVPNPQEQTGLLLNACRDADVPLHSLGYIEAHGTGTSLGDPIEIAAIHEAFRRAPGSSQARPTRCGVGSIKTNLGHLEAAAGLAGLIKVALSLEHGCVPRHLNFESLNPAIDLSRSPLFVTTEPMRWEGSTSDSPRRAGVSSFGSGGANGHAILEEYRQARSLQPEEDQRGPWLFVLSAKNEERLRAHANQFSRYVDGRGADLSIRELSSLAFTLQVGREVMAARLAFIASSAAAIRATLARFQEGKAAFDGSYDYHEDTEGTSSIGKDLEERNAAAVREAMGERALQKIASLWTAGAAIPWELLYGDTPPETCFVPTYPFARTKYWLDTAGERPPAEEGRAIEILHPLLDRNISTLDEQKFIKKLRSDEEILKHHVVLGTRILPGVAHLEMARAAAELSLQQPVRVIKNIIWGRAVLLEGESREIVIALRPEDKVVGFEIRSEEDASAVFSRGKIEVEGRRSDEPRRPVTYDLDAIRGRCPVRKNRSEIFEHLKTLGFDYGLPFQLTDALFSGQTEALVRLSPPAGSGGAPACRLNPALMDSAIRTSFLIGIDQNDCNDRLRIPFSLGKLEILAGLETARYAYARVVQNGTNGDFVSDVAILDESGRELLLFESFLAKPFRRTKPLSDSTLYLAPVWQEASLAVDASHDGAETTSCFVICGGSEGIQRKLTEGLTERYRVRDEQIVFVQPGATFECSAPNRYSLDLADPQQVHALVDACHGAGHRPTHIVNLAPFSSPALSVGAPALFADLQQTLDCGLLSVAALSAELGRRGPRDKVRILFCYPAGDDLALAPYDSVAGLAKAVPSAYPGISISCVQVDGSSPDPAGCVLEELGSDVDASGLEVRYESGKRFVRRLKRCPAPSGAARASITFQERGTYLITGGLGGLGLLFAHYLANSCRANLVLVGRSSLTPDKEEKLERLRAQATSAHYLSADVADHEELVRKLAPIRQELGPIHGVFHAAGVAGQRGLAEATRESFQADIDAKVRGTLSLDRLTSDDPLDCFILFSSLSSYLGDFGRGSYSAANRFLDSFAVDRNRLCGRGLRVGRTVSVNWPFWRDGGFGSDFFRDSNGEKLYFDYSGLRAISADEGLAAFEYAWALGEPQVVVATGDVEKIARVLSVNASEASAPLRQQRVSPGTTPAQSREATPPETGVTPQLRETVIGYLKDKIAAVIKAPASSIASQEPLGAYGIDSLIIMELNRVLEADFESLPGTLFFEFGTVHDLAGYFVKNHASRVQAILGSGPQPSETDIGRPVADEIVVPAGPRDSGRFAAFASEPPRSRGREVRDRGLDIAIIGVSGRYPQARTLERFWENLKVGMDAIEEIPATRWDYRKFYSPNEKQPGKTDSKWGGFVEDVDRFDAAFFNISPREAHYMDPQQRLFMEVAWETCEDAGYSWERTRNLEQLPKENQVGVFVGLMYDDYHFFEKKISTSYWNSFVANRVSHFFNFRGPSMTIDTACSSSLTTVYMACESLRNEHCHAAIAGGTNLTIHPRKYTRLSQLNMLSKDGKCKSFGKGGNGYVPGEGVGAVLLKRLEDAVRDGDHIYAVIKGGALNHGGKTNGFTVPNPNAHAELIAAAIDNSGVSPRTISYVEAHGTGTELGDPIEISGLTNAFRKHTADKQFCAIASVKSNIGHLEGAAGIAALTKVVLQLQHQQLVPSINAPEINPLIDFGNSPFALQRELAEWKRPAVTDTEGFHEYPRRAGISSFGAGGSNAHVIVEEYIPAADQHAGYAKVTRQQAGVMAALVPLSARTEERLQAYAQKLLAFCRRPDTLGIPLEDIAYTLQTGRQSMEWRAAFVARDTLDLCAKLEAFASGSEPAGSYRGQVRRGNEVVSVFGSDDDLKEAVGRWMAKRKLDKLAELWTRGLEVDWMLLWAERRPNRVSVPTYPFSGERYWVHDEEETTAGPAVAVSAVAVKVLHPLLHENVSTFAEQRFTASFSEASPFAIARSESGERRVSEAVYLEMARAAGVLASGYRVGEVRDFETNAPALLSARPSLLTISLFPVEEGAHFEIRGFGSSEDEGLLHAGGTLIFGKDDERSLPPLDIEAMRVKLPRSPFTSVLPTATEIHRSDREALASFDCPEPADDATMEVHPAAVAAAWETAAALLSDRGLKTIGFAPHRIGSLRLHGQPTRRGFVHARVTSDAGGVQIDVAAGDGRVFLSMHEVEFAPLHGDAPMEIRLAHQPPIPIATPNEIAVPLSPRKIPLGDGKPVMSGPIKKPAGISLAPAGGSIVQAPSSGKSLVALSPAILASLIAEDDHRRTTPVSLYDRGQGIFAIRIDHPASDAISGMRLALDRARRESSIKVLVINGLENCFPRGGREDYNEAVEQQLYTTLVSLPFPVIAALSGQVVGAGFLAASLCDLMVCSEEAHYAYTDVPRQFYPTAAEIALFTERFGTARARGLLFPSKGMTGKQLRETGWTCPIVAGAEVDAYAFRLASTLATKSRDALRLLKQHMARRLAGLAGELATVELPPSPAGDSPDAVARTIASPAQKIRLETPAEGVLVIRLDPAHEATEIGELFAHLGHLIAQAQESHYKAIVLAGGDGELLPAFEDEIGGLAARELQRRIVESEIPVVAALAGHARGGAWLTSQFCDTSVYSSTGVYSSGMIGRGPLSGQTAATILAYQFGRAAANEILLTGADYSGTELQHLVGSLTVVEHAHVLATAVDLATSWARLPRTVLAAWKRQTAAAVQERSDEGFAWAGPQQDNEAVPPSVDAPTAIPLRSKVVTMTAHPEGVVVVTMEDREARNMFSDALMEGVTEAFGRIEQTSSVKVVILTGYDRYFASGGTRESLEAIQQGRAKFTDFAIYQLALRCTVPVIAAMQGHGIGAGWSLGMFADIVLMSEESRYVSPYMNYGFTPGAGATWILPEKIGLDLARESLLTAQDSSGRELKERGLPLRVLPRADVVPAAMALASQIARGSRRDLIGLKRQLTAHVHTPLEEAYKRELAMHEETFVGQPETLTRIRESFHQELDAHPIPVRSAPVNPPSPFLGEGLRQAQAESRPADGDLLRSVSATLRALLAAELQMREHDVDENAQFVDLGLDSISGVTWVRKINERYRTAIEATRVYSYPTLTQLSRYVREEAERHGSLASERPTPPHPIGAPSVEESSLPRKVPAPASLPATVPAWRGRTATKAAAETSAPLRPSPIAVIGMAGQFPQANDLEQFWENIAQGKNCITPVPPKRWDVDAYYQPGEPLAGKTNSQWAGSFDGYDLFDPLFFNISPTEAESMDPQQRLFLQACWHSIENAGYDARVLSGRKCGVYVGCTNGDYHQLSRAHQLSAQGFTGSAMSILAARVSYFLNLQGACVSIDTACSSALVAVAQACDSLTAGNSDLALAGGVYVMTGPEMHIKTAQAAMLSPDGRCYTFDQRANGFVPGEGVGVVLLKRLADAERDGDLIHAVIAGWGVNQDGKTNGITAPNPESQARLEQDVYDRYGIDPADIGLIEAHGTGTKLGDPIEVEGLTKAFSKYTRNREYCALGSVKSNIGHSLAAAGIAGALKLILALKHKQLPPTINFERLNEHIDLHESPFYINAELRAWESSGRARQAATSSFGFSGTNAHVVIAEYLPPAQSRPPVTVATQGDQALIPLSAKTAEQLDQKAADLLDFLRRAPASIDLLEVAYTLQVGRAAMEERLGIVATSLEQLASRLEAYVGGVPQLEGVVRGCVKRTHDPLSIISQDEDVKEAIIGKWISGGKHSRLLDLWVNGLELDWSRLYGETRPRRVSLPEYPFAKERYWIDVPPLAPGHAGHGASVQHPMLHPMLHRNTSDLAEQRYSSTFTGEELFLADHRVRTDRTVQKVLPGVAYLEMARAAIQRANPDQREPGVLEIRDVAWLRPLVVAGQQELSIGLRSNDDGGVDYEVYSGDLSQEVVYCTGRAVLLPRMEPDRLDLLDLRRQMTAGRVEATTVYDLCERMGLFYGPGHQGIIALALGERQLLAELQLPKVAEAEQGDYVLHPSVLDSALQASIGLTVDEADLPEQPPVPFLLESLRVVSACAREMVAWVRFAEGSSAGDRIMKLDIDLCDLQGMICVQMRGFTSRAMGPEVKPSVRTSATLRNPDRSSELPLATPSFDHAFYQQLMLDVVNHHVSIDEAVELG